MTTAVAALPRRLHHYGIWGHSVAGYVTDYVLAVVCVACICLTARHRRQAETRLSRRLLVEYMAYAALTGVGFLLGGIAHHMIDMYGDEPLGRSWGNRNSGWLLPWTVSAFFMPAASNAGLVLVFSVARFPWWISFFTYLYGAGLGLMEVAVVCLGMTDNSGSITAYNSLFVYPLAAFCALIVAAKSAFRGIKDWTNPFQGKAGLMLANVIAFSGYVLVSFNPDTCVRSGFYTGANSEGDCPFAEEFNHNAIFHCMMAVNVVINYDGMRRAAAAASAEGEPDNNNRREPAGMAPAPPAPAPPGVSP